MPASAGLVHGKLPTRQFRSDGSAIGLGCYGMSGSMVRRTTGRQSPAFAERSSRCQFSRHMRLRQRHKSPLDRRSIRGEPMLSSTRRAAAPRDERPDACARKGPVLSRQTCGKLEKSCIESSTFSHVARHPKRANRGSVGNGRARQGSQTRSSLSKLAESLKRAVRLARFAAEEYSLFSRDAKTSQNRRLQALHGNDGLCRVGLGC